MQNWFNEKRNLQLVLTLILIATIPCYCSGLVVLALQPGNESTQSPPISANTSTITRTPTITLTPYLTRTSTATTIFTSTFTPTETPTITITITSTSTPTETELPTLVITIPATDIPLSQGNERAK